MALLKKLLRCLCLLLVLVFLSEQVLANWNEKGNGGDVISCKDPSQNMMFDAYEAHARHSLTPVYPKAQEAVTLPDVNSYTGWQDLPMVLNLAQAMVDRLAPRDASLHLELTKLIQNFPEEVRFAANTMLVNIEDTGLGFIPRGCEVQQLFVQRKPKFSSDSHYIVSLTYWQTLSIEQKAVGIMHEVLYRVALAFNSTISSSEVIRYFNALLISNTIGSLSEGEYKELKTRTFFTFEL